MAGRFCQALKDELLRDQKAHKLFQHELFGPHPKAPDFGPPEKSYVPHFLGKNAKEAHKKKHFRGILGGQKRGPKQAVLGHKKFSLVFLFCPWLWMNPGRPVTDPKSVCVALTSNMGDRFSSSAGTGKHCTLSMRVPHPYPVLDTKKIVHPWVQNFYPVLRLGSGGRLLSGFQTPVLYWINLSLR